MRNLLLHNESIAKYTKIVFALIFMIFIAGSSYSQCPTLRKVSVGECTNTGAGSQVLVAWYFDFDNSGNYTITVNDGNGHTITKSIGPSHKGTPYYLQEIVTPNGNTYNSTISISPGCATDHESYTLPPACPLNPTCGSGNLGGLVFADYDLDGAQGGSEGGLKGVIVKIYDDNQNMVATATTDVQGKWLATGLSNGQKLRIEYDYSSFPNVNPYKLGKKTGTTETTVQFATVPDCSNNLGLFLEEIYTDPNPRAATVRFMNANNLSPNSCSGAEQYVVVSYDYNASGPQFGSEGYNVPIDQGIAKAKDVGLVWGMAWNKYTGHVYTSAALRRHASTGPNGIGAIYASKQTAPGGAWATTLLIDLVSAGYDLGQNDMNWANRGLPDCKNNPSNDPEAYGLVGKVGFGDIDISADGTQLYAVNLKSRSMIILTLNAAGNMVTGQTEVPIPNPCANPIDWRPWALKVYKGKVYVGGVNAGYSSPSNYPNDDYHRLRAYVYEYDPTTGTFSSPILEQPLDYPHQGDNSTTRWYCWEDDYTVVLNNGWHQNFNQPILSDIEFDSYGNILLAYTDRGGIQWGWLNYPPAGNSLEYYFADGDITKGYKNEEGIFLTEDNGKIGYDTGCGSGGGNGPGGGEFYCGDNKYHPECAQGAVASHPSKNEMFMTFMDPYNIWSGGIGVLSHTNGQNQRGIELYYNANGGNTGWFGKAGGVGDVELLSSPISAVKQIGNRIWHDADYDGIQDPGETPLSGINVSLYNSGGTLVSNTTTDANGEYYFENYSPNTTYYIVVGEGGQFNTTTGKLNNLYSVTKNDIGMGDIPDLNDSDGTLKPSGFLTGYPYIQITSPPVGEVNHSYDFGFFPLAEIGNYVWHDVNADGIQNDGNTGLNGYEVKLYKGDGTFLSSTNTANHPTNGNPGYYLFPNLVPGDYYVCFNKGTNFLTSQDIGGNDGTDSDADPVTGCTIPTTLGPGESDMSWDAGIVIPCNITIGDYVWHDSDYDGIQDNGEQGISGVLVELLNSSGTVIATSTTNGSGKYEFKNITNVGVQNYTVRIAASNFTAGGVFESSNSLKWYPSAKDQGGDDTKDSDGDINDHTATVSMLCNTDLTVDFGFYKTCMTISKSANKTTARPGEVITYIFSVTNCGDVPLTGGVDFYDALLNPSPPHHIQNISPVNPGETKTFTKDYTVVVADCSILVNTVTAIGHPVNGTEDLTNTASYTIDINCKASIGNYVWEDKNANGIQDDGDTGINGIEVKLYTGAGVYVATKITANDPITGKPGYYVFTELEPGDYFVCFNKGAYVITTKDAGVDDAADSDADETSGCAVTTTLSLAENDMTWDAGLFKLASLGDYVWMDRDEDGCQDIDENPIKNVKVNLFKDDNIDGVADGPAIAQTQTDVNGFYQFISLRPGNYIVGFERPAGYKTIPQNSATCGDNMDSDASEATGLTGTINLESGEHDPTIDAGFKLRFDLALIKHDPAFPAKMGQPLTFNIEVFNQSEQGADVQAVEIVDYINLTAYDFNPAINPGWTLTGNKAKYTYSGPLLAQTSVIIPITLTVKYTATEATLKNEAEISTFKDMEGETQTEEKDSYPDDNPDNDNDVQCGSADDDNINGNVKEFPGQDEDDNDVACVEIFDLALKKLETSTGPYNFGDNVTFTLTVYNQGTIPATNIRITDYIPSGFEYNPALNPLWTQSNTTTPETTINSTVNPGGNTSVTIVLTMKSTNDLTNGWVNRAEISRAENESGTNLSDYDWDSNLDNNPNNDPGGNPDTGSDNSIDGNGTGNPGDTNPATDEDDADPARVKVYDLALTKKLLTPEPYTYYQDHTFEIEVFNQGNEIMKDVVVSDYIPSGYTFNAALNVGWTGAAPTVSRTIAQIDPGQSVKIQIVLKLVQTSGGAVNWINYSEIVSAKDKNGVNATTWDADSNPGSDSAHERAVKPGDADDDNIDGHYIPDGSDEDDHDPAGPKIFDLALKKVETSIGAYRYGDQVTFTYTVYNQGNIAAKDIEVMDYVPSGFKYVPALNPTWTQAAVTTPKKVVTGPLAPGSTTTVTIILVAQATTDFEDGWTNKAEIVKAKDPSGNNMSDDDLDSDLDNDPNNDVGGTPDTPEDDLVTDDGKDGDGDGVTDEDDADPARVKIYDLALTKKVLTPKPYSYYQDLTFEIEVYNQGNEIMKNVVVNDYIPIGYTFSAASNPAWSGAAPTVSRTIAQINPGQSVKIQIVLKLAQTSGGETHWDNYAEVASAQDKNGVNATTWDADSNPNSDSAHERAVKPGDADDDNINGHYVPDGTDEDDHDPAGVEVLDLALRKKTASASTFQYDQIVVFQLEIFNQGNEIAHDISIVDYVPSGYIYLPHLNPTWTQALTSTPSTVFSGPLAPGQSASVIINLQLQYTPEIGGYVNRAEISGAKDEQNVPFDDIDSDPDTNPNNDIGGTPLTPEDDHVNDDGKDGNGDGITDEDDEDPWTVPVSSIGNYVWYDNNDNGIQDDGLPSVVGVKDVLVILNDCADNEVLRMTTDVNGHYSFPNLIPGYYKIEFKDLPNNTIWAKQNIGNDALDSDPDSDGKAVCTNLEPGEDDPTWDAGILKLASLGDFVWLDTDNDGIQDVDESSVSGVTVRLLDINGNLLSTTTTNEQGYYLFDSLRPGTYYVQFIKPNGLEFTLAGQGADPNKDSNANPADGKTGGVILAAGDNRRDIDAGLKCTIDVQVSADVTICEGDPITISSIVTGGAPPISYLWTNSETTPNIVVTPSATTTYILTVTDRYGCEDTDQAVVTVEPKAKIGDFVWFDKDRDGIQDFYFQDPDLEESGINGVTVNLYKASDPNTIFMTQFTHANADTIGFYEFEVCKGDYFVEFVKPAGQGYIFTLQDIGASDALDSDADPVTGRTIAFHVEPGQIDHSRDAGFYLTASIGDRVWHDIDADGIQDPNEPGIPGVGVTLRDGSGNVIGTTTTNALGIYEFTGLIPDDYYVCFNIAGSGYTQVSPKDQGYNDAVDSDVDPLTGCTEITTIVANENDLTWDLGLYNLASLGDYVWLDKNANGCQEAGETGIAGVVVRLYRDNDANGVPDGAQIAQTTTNGTGYYIFNNLMAGTYMVKFDKPSVAYKSSPKNNNITCDDTSDSDGDLIFGYSDPVALSDNEHDPNTDQGYYQSAKVGDYVWYDIDGDGIQDANEPGVPGVTVRLYKDTDGDGIPETLVSTKVTNSGAEAGKYLFDNVDPGVYKICFDASNTQYEGFTKVDQGGNDATDSDASLTTGCTPAFTVQSGDDNRTFDAGLIILAELGDYVWEDRNADGYQDPTELPIANVFVELLDIGGNVLATKYTDANGLYKFEDLYPGDYVVRFTKPTGYESTVANNPISDAKDSDANVISGLSHVVNLEAGESDMTIDAGYYKPARLGDYVWEDTDADGIQDANENGINGIVVTLYDGSGNAVKNTVTGVNPVTGEDGYYIFDNLVPGTYFVCFNKGNYDKISPKDSGSNDAKDSDADPIGGCTVITVLESGETDLTWDAGLYNLASLGDYVWLDNNTNGIQDVAEIGINGIEVNLYKDVDKNGNPDGAAISSTTTITNLGKPGYYIFDNLEPGDYVVRFAPSAAYARTISNAGSDDTKDSDADLITGLSHSINLESGEHDPTIDAGYYYSASLGDYTWYDIDADGIQESNEKCMDSIKIKLYRVDLNLVTGKLDTIYVGQTWSHSVLDGQDTLKCGFYEFTNLQPGKYFLIFENPDPVVYSVSPKESLYNRAIDSNPNKQGNTSTFTLNPGEHNPTIDAGFYKGDCLLGVVWEENVSNQYNKVNVYDSLDYPVVGIQVDLVLDNDPFISTDDQIIMTDLTDAKGVYEFYNIPVGNYFIVLHLPEHLTVVNTNAGGDDINDNDFYLNEDTGQYRSQNFDITANNDEECKIDIKGGTGRKTFPSKVLYFDAVWDKVQDAVVLEWGAMDEINLNHYMIEKRAESGKAFEILGEVNAKGGLDLHEYELLDPNVEKGMRYYYRLVPIDNDGQRNQSYPDDVVIPGDKLGVVAYPNPTKALLNIEISGKQNQEIRIEVIDNVGRKAIRDVIIEKNSNIFERIGIDMSALPQGNYFVKVISGLEVMINRIVVIK